MILRRGTGCAIIALKLYGLPALEQAAGDSMTDSPVKAAIRRFSGEVI